MNKRTLFKIMELQQLVVSSKSTNSNDLLTLIALILEFYCLNKAGKHFCGLDIYFKMEKDGPHMTLPLDFNSNTQQQNIMSVFEKKIAEKYCAKYLTIPPKEWLSNIYKEEFGYLFDKVYHNRGLSKSDFLKNNLNKEDIISSIQECIDFAQIKTELEEESYITPSTKSSNY